MATPTKKNITDIVLIVASLIGAAITIADFFVEKLPKMGLVSIMVILALTWIYLILQRTVLKKDPDSYKNVVQTISNASVYILPVVIVSILAAIYFIKKGRCDDYASNSMTIGVAYFNIKTDEQAFSLALKTTLEEDIDVNSEIRVSSIPSYFDLKKDKEDILALLIKESENNCINRGIMVYGFRELSEELFNCRLFIKESEISKKIKGHPRKILDSLEYKIDLPQELGFKISYSVDTLSEIILGIANFHEGSLIEAKEQFTSLLNAAPLQTARSKNIFRFASFSTNQTPKSPEYQPVILNYLATIALINGNRLEAKDLFSQAITQLASSMQSESALFDLAYQNYEEMDRILDGTRTLAYIVPSVEDTGSAEGNNQSNTSDDTQEIIVPRSSRPEIEDEAIEGQVTDAASIEVETQQPVENENVEQNSPPPSTDSEEEVVAGRQVGRVSAFVSGSNIFHWKQTDVFKSHDGQVRSVVFSPDGKTKLTGSNDKTAILSNLKGREIQDFKGHSSYVNAVAFSPDGKKIITGSQDKTARLWDLKGNTIQEFVGHSGFVNSVAFSPNGKSILTGSADKTVRLWDLYGNVIQECTGHSGSVSSIAFSPNGKSILTGSADKTARLWDLKGNVIQEFKGHAGFVNSVAFSPNGKTVLTGSTDKTARLWNLNGKLIQEFKGHTGFINSVAFSPDGNMILTGSVDRTSRLWNLSGKKIQQFDGHSNAVWSVAFSPTGLNVLSGSSDETARQWTKK